MAETYLQFVPADPTCQSSPVALEEARVLLESILPDAHEVVACNYPGIRFFDSGQEWGYPTCPICGASSDGWFQEAMEPAWDEGKKAYRDLSIITPCCSNEIELDQLVFSDGDRFASFLLEAS